MKLLSDIEKTIERGFRHWTERVFGAAQSDELLLVHRGILEEIEGKIQAIARGKRLFPYSRATVTLASADPDRRATYQTAFANDGRLENDIRHMLESAECELPRGFAVEVGVADAGDRPFTIEYGAIPVAEREPAVETRRLLSKEPPKAPGRLVVVRGKAEHGEYTLEKTRTNVGRLAELTDSEQRVIRRNDIVFEEGGDEANATVSRRHAHVRLDNGEYRLCDDESEFGTRVFRDGRAIEVPAGNKRGERLRPGDEIYLGRACLRFER